MVAVGPWMVALAFVVLLLVASKGGLEVSVSVIGSLFASFVPCQVTLNQFTGVLDDDEVYLLPLGMVDPGKAG
jgi:hypothetical protein